MRVNKSVKPGVALPIFSMLTLALACGSTPVASNTPDTPDEPSLQTPQADPFTFGGAQDDDGVAIVPAADGGWFIAANTSSQGEGGQDIWLIKVDQAFGVEWERTFGTADEDQVWHAESDGEGGVLISGDTRSRERETGAIVFIRVSGEGEVLWNHTYDIPGRQARGYVQRVGPDGYILSGWSTTEGALADFLLVRTDAAGQLLWHRSYGGSGLNGANAVRVTADGGFVVFGEGLWMGGDNYEIWQGILVRADSEGNLLWHSDYGGAGPEEGYGLALAGDGGFLVGGFFRSGSQRGGYCVKTDADGEQEWLRTIPRPMVVFHIQPVDGGFLLVGPDGLRKIDGQGNSLWAREYPELSSLRAVTVRADGSLIIVGAATSGSAGGQDVAILLTDAGGNPH